MTRAASVRPGLRRIARSFWSRFGVVILAGGLALTAIGAWVQVVRWVEVKAAERGTHSTRPGVVPRPEAVPPGGHQAQPQPASIGAKKPTGTGGLGEPPAGMGDSASARSSPGNLTQSAALSLPDYLVIPAIGLSTRIVPVGWTAEVISGGGSGNEWETADFAAGFHQSSAPLGAAGNTVLSGHNNVRGEVFRDLHRLKAGERILVTAGKVQREFVVAENFVVKEAGASLDDRRANAAWIAPTQDERLTLVTCYPPWSNTHRTIVVAFPAPAQTDSIGGRDAVLAK